MEISAWTMYLFTRLDGIYEVSTVLSVLLVLVWVAIAIFLVVADIDDEERLKKKLYNLIKLPTILLCIFVPIAILVPTTKQMAAICIIPKIANNEVIQQLPDELTKLGMEWLQELRPTKENN